MANSLSAEKSVYLQQHANNPVHWFPWGKAAFEKARLENKPLLVSIGYSTCHWCHVMEHESFEDPEVAAFLNAHFVAIKVDREEHPDVDEFYMDAVQALTRRGGWPLNMFTTPDLLPFFGGTYFPKPTFLNLLQQIRAVWTSDPARVHQQAQQLREHLASGNVFTARGEASDLDAFRAKLPRWRETLLETQLREFDPVYGGFGAAPKFPRAHALSALLRAAVKCPDMARKSSGLFACAQTLKGMAYGGMRDHLRGGFHRYSTDERWLVPHFEKMLYDQALLVKAYSEAYRVFREPFYADVVEETLDYLEAEMRLPEGGFAAAQDADSEGEEGKFYVWKRDEIRAALTDEPAELVEKFCRLHSVSEGGNWEHTNVLAAPLDAEWGELSAPEMRRLRARLLGVRATRPAPVRDPKMIVAWNAWMASGLLRASLNLLDRPALSAKLLASAERTINWLMETAGAGGELPRVIYGRERKGDAYLEDYAAVIEALQLLALRGVNAEASRRASQLLARTESLFRGPEGRLRGRRPGTNAELPHDRLEFHDGATPAPLSVYVGCLLRQSLVDSRPDLSVLALRDVASLERVLDQYPVAVTHLLAEATLVEGRVIKAPDVDAVLAEWAKRAELAGDLLLAPAPEGSREFQACDFTSCFARGADAAAVWG